MTSPRSFRYRVLWALVTQHCSTPARCDTHATCTNTNTLKRYRIHYPGWDSNWDEWVCRDRLRWPVDSSYLSTRFRVRQVVEVWCTGTHVKGAWLQARVKQVHRTVQRVSFRAHFVARVSRSREAHLRVADECEDCTIRVRLTGTEREAE